MKAQLKEWYVECGWQRSEVNDKDFNFLCGDRWHCPDRWLKNLE